MLFITAVNVPEDHSVTLWVIRAVHIIRRAAGVECTLLFYCFVAVAQTP